MDWEAFYNSFRQPDFIPGYEIEHRLGGGAFGEVYKARKQSIGKSYAIKFLKIDDGAQKDAIERELEQVRHFAAIDHPNLVTIEDMGTVLDVPYLVMGYAGELTLGRRQKRGDLSREQALSFFIQTCRGVLALHDRRLVHFDLKPGNVFLHGDVARVGDYGLSKLMTDGRMTLSFGRGTPHYMAPEMVKGRADHRADIYSLGVMLFESVAGRVPYEIKSSVGIVLRQDDTPPEFPDDYPADLRIVTERCLRLDPEDRYDDVAALLEALGQTARRGDSIRLDQVQDEARPLSLPERAFAGGVGATAGVADPAGAAKPGEIRQTAAELTRGAVEVARGVWDGLRTVKGSSSTVALEAEAARRTGDGATPENESSSTVSTAGVGRGLNTEQEPRHAGSSDGPLPGAEATPTPAANAGTIPVPPQASGGPIGTLFSTVGLAAEVFFSLVRGVFSTMVGFVWKRHRRIVHSDSTLVSKGLRLGGFYFLLLIGLSILLNIFVQATS